MILRLGDLIDFADAPTKRLRVIWMSPDNTSVATIQVEVDKALPAIVPVQPLLDELEAGTASLMLEDPYRVLVAESGVKASHKGIRDRAWKLIENLVRDAPDIFSPHRRAALVEETVKKARTNTEGGVRNVTRTTMYRYLRRFWVRGLTPNALLPDYRHSGGKGKTRKASSKKRGRPRKYGTEKGINITEAIRKIFRVAISRCYASDRKRKWMLKDTFGYVIDNYFADKTIDPETGRIVHVPNDLAKKEGGVPTARQFQYWVDKDHIRLEIKRKRMGAKIYDKDLRGLPAGVGQPHPGRTRSGRRQDHQHDDAAAVLHGVPAAGDAHARQGRIALRKHGWAVGPAGHGRLSRRTDHAPSLLSPVSGRDAGAAWRVLLATGPPIAQRPGVSRPLLPLAAEHRGPGRTQSPRVCACEPRELSMARSTAVAGSGDDRTGGARAIGEEQCSVATRSGSGPIVPRLDVVVPAENVGGGAGCVAHTHEASRAGCTDAESLG